MINISANIPNDTPKPTPESIASLRRHCMFFPSNGFIVIPPILLFIIRHRFHKSYIEKENLPCGKESTQFGQSHKGIQIMYTSSIARWRENYDFNGLE